MTERNDNLTEVIDGRHDVYGDPKIEMPNVAKVWSGITGHEITPEMVPLMLIGYKLVRARRAPDYSDNSDDVEGYLDIFRTVVGEDMVHARSVTEYLQLKEQREHSPMSMSEKLAEEIRRPGVVYLDWLDIDIVTRNALRRRGYNTANDVAASESIDSLIKIPNIGVGRATQVKIELEKHGLSLRES